MEFRAHLEILQTHPLLSAAKTVERIEITVPAFFALPLHYEFISSAGDPLLTTRWNWKEFFAFR